MVARLLQRLKSTFLEAAQKQIYNYSRSSAGHFTTKILSGYQNTYNMFDIFQEFLKKEFSHENIYFWTACERYRKIKGDDEDSVKVRMAAAENIIKRHLSSGAPEPVNVDSHARQAAQEGPPTSHLFATAQKQIYNLMKFDSFR